MCVAAYVCCGEFSSWKRSLISSTCACCSKCAAVYYSKCVAVYCSKCVAVRCSALQCDAACCSSLSAVDRGSAL